MAAPLRHSEKIYAARIRLMESNNALREATEEQRVAANHLAALLYPQDADTWEAPSASVPILAVCPDCSVRGPAVYRAESHPMSCSWMMDECPRCSTHDELLRPDEPSCPFPDVDDDGEDPHQRLVA